MHLYPFMLNKKWGVYSPSAVGFFFLASPPHVPPKQRLITHRKQLITQRKRLIHLKPSQKRPFNIQSHSLPSPTGRGEPPLAARGRGFRLNLLLQRGGGAFLSSSATNPTPFFGKVCFLTLCFIGKVYFWGAVFIGKVCFLLAYLVGKVCFCSSKKKKNG